MRIRLFKPHRHSDRVKHHPPRAWWRLFTLRVFRTWPRAYDAIGYNIWLYLPNSAYCMGLTLDFRDDLTPKEPRPQ